MQFLAEFFQAICASVFDFLIHQVPQNFVKSYLLRCREFLANRAKQKIFCGRLVSAVSGAWVMGGFLFRCLLNYLVCDSYQIKTSFLNCYKSYIAFVRKSKVNGIIIAMLTTLSHCRIVACYHNATAFCYCKFFRFGSKFLALTN